jgi:hypothetical protein
MTKGRFGHDSVFSLEFLGILRGIAGWQLEGGSRKRASYSDILERHWRHTLQAKSPRRGKTLTPPHLQLAQRISTSC